MNASRASNGKSRRAALLIVAAAAAIAFAVAAGPAAAQVGEPIRLAPPAPGDAPTRLAPPSDEPPAPELDEASPPGGRARIEVKPLSALDADSVGLIDAAQGGLGPELWSGTPRALVERLLPRLPAAPGSRAARALALRLLLTRAAAPEGAPTGNSLLALRVERLLAMGEIDSTTALLRVAPPELVHSGLARSELEALFFRNDNAGACARVRRHADGYRGGYWRQANAFCLALAGEFARSSMIADLLRERDGGARPAFFTLIDVLAGHRDAAVDSLADADALHLAMMRAASLELPADVAGSTRPGLLRAVAHSPNAALELRLGAAERAEAMGALSVEELTELYDAVTFDQAAFADPVASATAIWGPRGRALLLRAAARVQDPTARAEALRRGWRLARELGGHRLMQRASVPILLAIAPSEGLVWFAGDAARALFAAGRTESALAWFALADRLAAENEEARVAADSLRPLAVIAAADGSIEWGPAQMAQWWSERRARAGDGARAGALLLCSMLDALGIPVGDEMWTALLGPVAPGGGRAPDAALWHALDRAAGASRRGEVVLLALLAVGDAEPGAANPLTLAAAVGALRRVGLEAPARALALEAAVAAAP